MKTKFKMANLQRWTIGGAGIAVHVRHTKMDTPGTTDKYA